MSNLLSPIYKCLSYTFCMVAIDDVKKMMYDFYKINNIPYIESHANFVYYSMNTYKGDFAKELENRKILCSGINEEKGKWYRVTIGTENEMKQYMKAVSEIISK